MSLNCSVFSDTQLGDKISDILSKDTRIKLIDSEFYQILNSVDSFDLLDLVIFNLQQPDRIIAEIERINRLCPNAFLISIFNPNASLTGFFYSTIYAMSDSLISCDSIEEITRYIDILCNRHFCQVRRVDLDCHFDRTDLQILKRIQLGKSNENIAVDLSLSISTVKRRVADAIAKLECDSRSEVPVRSIRVVGDLSEYLDL
ncbi:MAG: hypothetical protein HC778_00105 [Chamaesiphon sp. CSU_1_12]|nr:hypothetical protein [Chamaesiphon sp. CSU_1_12]